MYVFPGVHCAESLGTEPSQRHTGIDREGWCFPQAFLDARQDTCCAVCLVKTNMNITQSSKYWCICLIKIYWTMSWRPEKNQRYFSSLVWSFVRLPLMTMGWCFRIPEYTQTGLWLHMYLILHRKSCQATSSYYPHWFQCVLLSGVTHVSGRPQLQGKSVQGSTWDTVFSFTA